MPTELVVHPRQSVGPIVLGATRGEARAAMPAVPIAFGKGPGETPSDAWHDFAVQVFYDADDRVEYVEIERGEEVRAVLFGQPVLELPCAAAIELVERHARHDPEDRDLPDGWTFPDLDVSLWRPHDGQEDAGCFAALGVGRRGYFAR